MAPSRGMKIMRKHLEKYGFTAHCRKCIALRAGDMTQPAIHLGHSRACVKRIRDLALQDPEFAERAAAGLARTAANAQSSAPSQGPMPAQGAGEQEGTSEAREAFASSQAQEPEAAPPAEEAEEHGRREAQGSSSSSGSSSSAPVPPSAPNPDQEGESHEASGGDLPLPVAGESRPLPPAKRQKHGPGGRARVALSRRERGEQEDVEEAQEQPRAKQPRLSALGPSTADSRYDVCEIFSPPRVAQRARETGRRGGWSLDISEADPITGRTWDLLCPKTVAQVKAMMRRDRPRLLIASPPCTPFSNLQTFHGGPDPVELQKGIRMMEVAVELCKYQVQLGGSIYWSIH